MNVKEIRKLVHVNILSFLSDKPVWAFWMTYILLSLVYFGIFYVAMYFMAMYWWIPIATVLVCGIIWGSVVFARNEHEPVRVSTK